MYRIVFLFVFFYIVNLNPALSQVKMLPTDILQINSSSDLEFDFSFLDHASNYFISEKNQHTVELKYLGLTISVMDLYFLTAYQEQSLQFDLNQQEVIESTEITRYDFIKSELLHTDTSALVNGVTIELKQSSYLEEIECIDSGPRLYDRFCNISSKLK